MEARTKKMLNTVATVLGLGEACLCSGCVENNGSQPVFAGTSITETGRGLAGQASRPDFIPLRISRSFFDHAMKGSVSLHAVGEDRVDTVDSSVSWQVKEPTAPAPTGDYQADFRDQMGCATFDEAKGASLCFTLPGDVSSVDLTAKKLQAQGLESLVAQKAGGECKVKSVKFTAAAKSAQGLSVVYQAERDGGCGTVEVELSLSRG